MKLDRREAQSGQSTSGSTDCDASQQQEPWRSGEGVPYPLTHDVRTGPLAAALQAHPTSQPGGSIASGLSAFAVCRRG